MFIPETLPDTLWSLGPQSQEFFSGWPEECRPTGKGLKRSVKMWLVLRGRGDDIY